MADSNQIRDITRQLEDGVKALLDSEKYADYLRTMSKFHTYSTRNVVLIHLQKPDATMLPDFAHGGTILTGMSKKVSMESKFWRRFPLTKRKSLKSSIL